MGKNDFMTPKAVRASSAVCCSRAEAACGCSTAICACCHRPWLQIANRIKAKGLNKLRWYCQLCQKSCRDENGFKCHQMSEGHRRQMEVRRQSLPLSCLHRPTAMKIHDISRIHPLVLVLMSHAGCVPCTSSDALGGPRQRLPCASSGVWCQSGASSGWI